MEILKVEKGNIYFQIIGIILLFNLLGRRGRKVVYRCKFQTYIYVANSTKRNPSLLNLQAFHV